jgi:hypothetical protein
MKPESKDTPVSDECNDAVDAGETENNEENEETEEAEETEETEATAQEKKFRRKSKSVRDRQLVRKIMKLSESHRFMIQKAVFQRLIREIAYDFKTVS